MQEEEARRDEVVRWLDGWVQEDVTDLMSATRALLRVAYDIVTWRPPGRPIVDLLPQFKLVSAKLPRMLVIHRFRLGERGVMSLVLNAWRSGEARDVARVDSTLRRYLGLGDRGAQWNRAVREFGSAVANSVHDRVFLSVGATPWDRPLETETLSQELFELPADVVIRAIWDDAVRRPSSADELTHAIAAAADAASAERHDEAASRLNGLFRSPSFDHFPKDNAYASAVRHLVTVIRPLVGKRDYATRAGLMLTPDLLGPIGDRPDWLENYLAELGAVEQLPRVWRGDDPAAYERMVTLASIGQAGATRDTRILRGAAACLTVLGSGSPGRADVNVERPLQQQHVKTFLCHDDPVIREAGIRMLPFLSGNDTARLLLDAHELLDDSTARPVDAAWRQTLDTLPTPTDEACRSDVLDELTALVSNPDRFRRHRRPLFSYLMRVANAANPQVNKVEADLGLPLAT
jgi:hypothetical protein